jgi:hypothetical protein
MAMAAVIREDGGLSPYDLLTAPDGMQELLPALHVALPNARGPMRFFNWSAATWFDRDGDGIHAAYPIHNPSGDLFPATGLVHLRFD